MQTANNHIYVVNTGNLNGVAPENVSFIIY